MVRVAVAVLFLLWLRSGSDGVVADTTILDDSRTGQAGIKERAGRLHQPDLKQRPDCYLAKEDNVEQRDRSRIIQSSDDDSMHQSDEQHAHDQQGGRITFTISLSDPLITVFLGIGVVLLALYWYDKHLSQLLEQLRIYHQRKEEIERKKAKIKKFTKLFESYRPKLEDDFDKLLQVADKLQATNKRIMVGKTLGSGYGVVGGICRVAGLALAPFTAGTSTFLATTGMTFSVAGGGVEILADVLNSGDVNELLECGEMLGKQANGKFQELYSAMKTANEGVVWVREFLLTLEKVSRFDFHPYSLKKIAQFKDVHSLAKAIVELEARPELRMAAEIACKGSGSKRVVSVIGKAAPVAMSKGARIAAGAAAGALLVWDITNIVKNAMELDKGCNTAAAEGIRDVVAQMKLEVEDLQVRYKDLTKIINSMEA